MDTSSSSNICSFFFCASVFSQSTHTQRTHTAKITGLRLQDNIKHRTTITTDSRQYSRMGQGFTRDVNNALRQLTIPRYHKYSNENHPIVYQNKQFGPMAWMQENGHSVSVFHLICPRIACVYFCISSRPTNWPQLMYALHIRDECQSAWMSEIKNGSSDLYGKV